MGGNYKLWCGSCELKGCQCKLFALFCFLQLLCTHTHASSSITLSLPPCSPFTSLLSSSLSHFLKVHRLPVEECSNFTDCSACIMNGGLLCGWCSVENKCSRRPQCANSNSSDGLRWVQTTDRCLTVDITSAVSISGEETAYPRETSSIVSQGWLH